MPLQHFKKLKIWIQLGFIMFVGYYCVPVNIGTSYVLWCFFSAFAFWLMHSEYKHSTINMLLADFITKKAVYKEMCIQWHTNILGNSAGLPRYIVQRLGRTFHYKLPYCTIILPENLYCVMFGLAVW